MTAHDQYVFTRTLEKAITRYSLTVTHERKTKKEETRLNCYLLAEACEEAIPQMLKSESLKRWSRKRLTEKYEAIYERRRKENY